ncbi:MAG: exodeoxyribonuclease VII small subunit [Lactobacillus sp.]|jgi:exodeoxyribonuclease VII small subunit|uniref:Exodeoxyribonuclease 7 small subunit n=1 Tax=Lacticaseibacillus suilingensis TaxID=2799577 RepID=A0ABW4BFD4_9LACO|nr:exodeoxyribonuclease VII small subunit [Lacticaseibacillus suilingensis]MCI1894597.1 exodeoxyribonuclease VII small subunit [Lactobacillus sp.]MCI1918124.1 exodeoxyribonuclease VII small subunit [Lactobacillus sp.]MCI1940695.1 exodeoxyribonuclease VII small subunit [Lactobacillus sp.]MCI1971381.1 exodeoxyribonuclease VII small subunit [Lactobacillus sp.]MCI2017162.1 exodeoxyribonuclease VII small subunit [Lactobacillus sp.]
MAEPTFEANLQKLETIVTQLEQGQVPLEEALEQYKTGIKLSQQLEATLKNAEQTVTQMVKEDGTVASFDPKADQHA